MKYDGGNGSQAVSISSFSDHKEGKWLFLALNGYFDTDRSMRVFGSSKRLFGDLVIDHYNRNQGHYCIMRMRMKILFIGHWL